MSSPRADSRLTRRQWTAVLSTAIPLSAQVAQPPVTEKTPPLGQPSTPAPTDDPASTLSKAVDEVRQVSERLAAMEVPMNVEPAFLFRA